MLKKIRLNKVQIWGGVFNEVYLYFMKKPFHKLKKKDK